MVDKDVLKGLVDEFVNRIDNLQENISNLKGNNKELS